MPEQPVHILLTMKVKDPALLADYFTRATPLMVQAGVELLSAGTNTVTLLEGQWDHQRVALMRAPSREAWRSFYTSEAYERIKPLRLEATDSMMALLDGVEFTS